MEFALSAILYVFQKLMNTLLNLTVDGGGSVGLIILTIIILGFILSKFSISSSREESGSDE